MSGIGRIVGPPRRALGRWQRPSNGREARTMGHVNFHRTASRLNAMQTATARSASRTPPSGARHSALSLLVPSAQCNLMLRPAATEINSLSSTRCRDSLHLMSKFLT